MRFLFIALCLFGCSDAVPPKPSDVSHASVRVEVPVPAEPVPTTAKLMGNAEASYCALTARILIEPSITNLNASASVQTNYRQLVLDPRGNQWEATHVLIAPVVFTLPSGNRNKQIWAIYCADNEVIHVEHCHFGNLPAE